MSILYIYYLLSIIMVCVGAEIDSSHTYRLYYQNWKCRLFGLRLKAYIYCDEPDNDRQEKIVQVV